MTLGVIGLKDSYTIRVNPLGIEKEKVKYREELISFYENKKHLLSPESQEILEKDPIKLLSSEEEDEKILASQAPNIIKLLKKESKAHREKFLEYLDVLEVPYVEDHTLVGDYDYNTHMAWELRCNQ
jgi:histidyl-tRNA synthetase